MGWADAPSPPPPPDPAIQTSNEAAANRYNISSPFGSQTWTSGGREVIGYDSSNRPIYGERYTQNIELNPSEQRQYDLRNAISEATMQEAQQGIGAGLPDYSPLEANPGRPGDIQAPGAPGAFNPRAVNPDARPGEFDPGLSDPGTYSMDSSVPDAARAHYDRIASMMDPYFERQQERFDQRMSNQGLPIGSEAYSDAYGDVLDSQNRQIGDAAYESAMRAPELSLAERGQQMSDRGQVFGEDVTTRGVQMQDRGQLFDELLSSYGVDLSNRGQQMGERGQLFGEQLATQQDARTGYQQYQSERGRQFDEDLARRQQYYNEIAAALGGQQLNPINAGGGGGDMPLNVSGAFDAYNSGVMNNYNQSAAARNNMIAAIAGLGGSALTGWGGRGG